MWGLLVKLVLVALVAAGFLALAVSFREASSPNHCMFGPDRDVGLRNEQTLGHALLVHEINGVKSSLLR